MHCYTHLILFRLQQFQKKILFGNSSLNDVRIKVEIQLCQVNNSGMGWAGDTVVKELPGTCGSHRVWVPAPQLLILLPVNAHLGKQEAADEAPPPTKEVDELWVLGSSPGFYRFSESELADRRFFYSYPSVCLLISLK